MKKALIGLLAAGTLVGCGGNTYTITGKLDPGITDSVFLMQGNPENPTIASAAVAADGTFKIKGTIDQPDLAILPTGTARASDSSSSNREKSTLKLRIWANSKSAAPARTRFSSR